jgi:hypothetical protein
MDMFRIPVTAEIMNRLLTLQTRVAQARKGGFL